uniref:Chemokine interleukin-8-like domain-containing protein n=1 Tax=Anser brachyrhynchus TaxID=132585 RepID=A0A8B9BQU9_9AVES
MTGKQGLRAHSKRSSPPSEQRVAPDSLAEAVPPAPGAPLAGELRCRCVQAVTEVIPPRRLAGLELVPAGPHCAVPEVIATTKAGRTLCLSPSAPWVQLLVTRLLRRGSCNALGFSPQWTTPPETPCLGLAPLFNAVVSGCT